MIQIKLLFLVVAVVFYSTCCCGYSYPPNGALPNIVFLGLGYDALKGQPVVDSLRYPVVDVTYFQNRTVYISGTRFIFPDQAYVLPDPGADSSNYAEVFTSAQEVQQSLTASLSQGFKVPFIKGMFGISEQASFFSQQNTKYASYTAFTNLRIKSWKAGFNASLKNVTSNFASFVAQLPTEYNNNTCPYFKKFIQYFGTHYLNQVLFGGTVSMTSSFSMSQYNSVGATQVSADLSMQLFILQLGASASAQQQQELQQLNAKYSSQTHLVGGDPSHYSVSQWDEWAATVPDNPIPIAMDFPLLSEFLPQQYADRKDALELAIKSYLSKGWPSGWITKAPMPTARCSFAAAAVNGIIYAIGGSSKSSAILNTVQAYNPQTNSWTTKTSMPTGRSDLAAVAVDGIIYAIGGWIGNSVLNTVQAYNPQTNSWTTKASMPTARFELAAVAVDGIIYAIGGFSSNYNDLSTVEAYNPQTNSWTTKASMPTMRTGLAAVAVNEIIYAIGGYNGNYLNTVEAYNPQTNSWTTKTSMPTMRAGFDAVAVDEIIYAIGGQNDYYLNIVEAYNPQTNSWTTKASMPTARDDLAAVAVNEIIYAIGGNNGSYLNTVEAYLASDVQAMSC